MVLLRFAMLSRWHVHALGYARMVQSMPDATITAVWDEDAQRGADWAQELGVAFEAKLDAVLAREDVDAVIIDAPTNMHGDIMMAAARAKKHIFTEKVMCLTVAECRQVAKVIEENGVTFGISMPQRTAPSHILLKNIAEQGLLGDITAFRMRDAHDGASSKWLPDYWYDPITTGGGAMMDLGAHPMYLSWWIMGRPQTIRSAFTFKTNSAIEDNATSTMTYANGAVAIVDTSLVSGWSAHAMEIYGTEGCAIVSDDDVKLRSRKIDMPIKGWIHPELPKGTPMPLFDFVDCVANGKPYPYNLAEAIGLTELMENAYIAHNEGRTVTFA